MSKEYFANALGDPRMIPGGALVCPSCAAELLPSELCSRASTPGLRCAGCGLTFPLLAGVPCLLVDADGRIAAWRAESATYAALTAENVSAIAQELDQFSLLSATRRRLETLHRALEDNTSRVLALLSGAGLSPGSERAP